MSRYYYAIECPYGLCGDSKGYLLGTVHRFKSLREAREWVAGGSNFTSEPGLRLGLKGRVGRVMWLKQEGPERGQA